MNATFTPATAPVAEIPAPAKAKKANAGRSRLFILFWRIVVIAMLCLIWEWLAWTGYADARFVGRPSAVLMALWKLIVSGTLWQHAISTITATLFAFAVGSALGVIAGLILAASRTLDEILDPVVNALNSIPRVALAPLFILWFGIGIESKAFAGFTLVFFILLITTRSGLKNADPDLLIMARMLCATKMQTFLKVVVPISIPSIFSGLQLAVIYSLLGVVVAEMIASQRGLGVVVSQYAQTFSVNETFAVLIVLGILSSLLATAVRMIEAHVLRWQEA
jgi:NitT/TauT family transport system permease protein